MSKNELRVIARIVLIGVGLYVLLQAALSILSSLPLMLTVARDEMNAMAITAMVIYIMLGLAVTFRLVCIVAGLLYLYWTIFNSIATIGFYISVKLSHAMTSTPTQLWSEVIKCVIQIGLGIYLVLGAPSFVRWQVRRGCPKLS